MSRIVQVLAVVLGAVWFLPISCTTGMFAAYPLVSKSYEHHMEKGEEPYSMFTVVFQPGAGSEPFGSSRLADLARAEKSATRSYFMAQPTGRSEGGGRSGRDVVVYKVLSSSAAEQLIEVRWAGDTYGSVSRYRATHAGVTPVFSKVEAPDIMIKALLLAMAVSAALFAVGKWLRRRVVRAKAASDVSSIAASSG